MSWLGVMICVAVSFVFSGTEAGILSLNRVRLAHRLKRNDPGARTLHRLLKRPERLLITILLVTNFSNICAVLLVTRICVDAWGAPGYLASAAICLPVWQFFLELLPKSLFRRIPYRALAAFSALLQLADLALSPFLVAGNWLLRLLPGKEGPETRKLFAAREDLKYLTIESESQGTLTPLERGMIHNVVDLRATRAADVMIPMDKVRSLPASATVPELLELARESGLERFPLIDRNGNLVALVNVFEVLLEGARKPQVAAYQRRIVTVTPEEEAYTIMKKMRAARTTLAAVRTGEEKAAGVVGFEDLTAKLVKMGGENEESRKKA